jgi:hypothetical protein
MSDHNLCAVCKSVAAQAKRTARNEDREVLPAACGSVIVAKMVYLLEGRTNYPFWHMSLKLRLLG